MFEKKDILWCMNIYTIVVIHHYLSIGDEDGMHVGSSSPRGVPSLQFNSNSHPHSTLKAFEDFIEQFHFCYQAMFPEVQKHVLDNAVEKWKSENNNPENVSVAQKETIKADIQSREKVRKLLGFFPSHRLQQD